MKTGFRDRTEIPEGKKIKEPWTVKNPHYDQRSSCYVSAGCDYGVGVQQPVGREGNPKKEGVPFGRPNTMKVDYVHKGQAQYFDIEEDK